MTIEKRIKNAKSWWYNLDYSEQRYLAETYFSTDPEQLTDTQILYIYES